MKRVLLVITLAAVVVLPLLATACGGQGLSENDIKTIQGFGARLDSLEKQMATVKSDISNLNPADLTQINEDIAAIKADLEAIKATDNSDIAALKARVKALEDKPVGSGGDTDIYAETTRWGYEVSFEPELNAALSVDYALSPSRIEEDDTYRLIVTLVNTSGADIAAQNREYMTVMILPRTKDTAIDADNTAAYALSPATLDWYTTFAPSVENRVCYNCRRIEFSSDEFNIPAIANNSTYSIKLEFDLVYAGS